MNDLLNVISKLGAEPLTWAVLALFAAKAVHSIILYRRCPYCWSDDLGVAPDEARRIVGRRIGGSPRFLVLMAAGIMAAVAGLYMLVNGGQPVIALFLMVGGAFLFLTEPARLSIVEARLQVVGVRGDDEARDFQVENLKNRHRDLLKLEIGIPATLCATLAAI